MFVNYCEVPVLFDGKLGRGGACPNYGVENFMKETQKHIL